MPKDEQQRKWKLTAGNLQFQSVENFHFFPFHRAFPQSEKQPQGRRKLFSQDFHSFANGTAFVEHTRSVFSFSSSRFRCNNIIFVVTLILTIFVYILILQQSAKCLATKKVEVNCRKFTIWLCGKFFILFLSI